MAESTNDEPTESQTTHAAVLSSTFSSVSSTSTIPLSPATPAIPVVHLPVGEEPTHDVVATPSEHASESDAASVSDSGSDENDENEAVLWLDSASQHVNDTAEHVRREGDSQESGQVLQVSETTIHEVADVQVTVSITIRPIILSSSDSLGIEDDSHKFRTGK